MKTLVINNHSKYLEQLISIFPNVTVIDKENLDDNFNPDLYNLMVFSGGSNIPTVLRHPEQYNSEFNLINKAKIPIIGICLGSEIITKAFNGELKELPIEHRGKVKLKITELDLININGSDTLEVNEAHHIGIKTIPANFISCAYSEHGTEIIKHINKPIIALQFHPEISNNENLVKWILDTVKV